MRNIKRPLTVLFVAIGVGVSCTSAEATTLSGTVQLDFAQTLKDPKESVLEVGTVELGIGATVIVERVQANLLFLAEGDLENPTLDEAFFSFRWHADSPFSMVAGRTTMPFGTFNTHLISDPLIIDAEETIVPGLVLNYANKRPFVRRRFAFGLESSLAIFQPEGENVEGGAVKFMGNVFSSSHFWG